jgi:hypothetical protein
MGLNDFLRIPSFPQLSQIWQEILSIFQATPSAASCAIFVSALI